MSEPTERKLNIKCCVFGHPHYGPCGYPETLLATIDAQAKKLAAAEALLARRPHIKGRFRDDHDKALCADSGGACATIEAVEPAKGSE